MRSLNYKSSGVKIGSCSAFTTYSLVFSISQNKICLVLTFGWPKIGVKGLMALNPTRKKIPELLKIASIKVQINKRWRAKYCIEND